MASEPLQRDLPGVLCLGRVLAIEDMAPAGDHDQFDVTAQGCQTRCQALGLIHGRSPLAGLPHHPGSAGVSEVRGGCWRGAVAAPVGCARKGPAQKCRLFFLSAHYKKYQDKDVGEVIKHELSTIINEETENIKKKNRQGSR